ncbi:AI-2E family transporter [Mycobacterium sp.]|uniref:AI-2E family transporter n=1 Tax=Mycobacterium sp. TaxID=1785 RepID=UPI0031D93457
MDVEFTPSQKRTLAVFTVIALLFAGYLLRSYFVLIVVAAVGAYLFTPLFTWFDRRLPTGLAATCTLLAVLVCVIAPVALVLVLATVQVSRTVSQVADWMARTDLSALGEKGLHLANDLLARVPFLHTTVTAESLRSAMVSVAQKAGQWFLHILQSTAGGFFGAIVGAIIFVYLFMAFLVNRAKLHALVRDLNPLGDEVTDLYLQKMGAMVVGTVRGQFVIALCQGLLSAGALYIGGFHHGFFIFAIVFTAMSVVPVGAGIATIPIGIGMAVFGNYAGGVFVVLWHVLVVTNIDVVLRPILVPREAALPPALMLLAVFAGLGMFGPWGIVIGPVLMIVIVTTLDVYRAAYTGVEVEESDEVPATKAAG